MKSLEFIGMSVVGADSGEEIVDEAVCARAKCFLVLEACARYLEDLKPLCTVPQTPETEDTINRLTVRLGVNVVKVTRADGALLARDLRTMAAHFEMDLEPVIVPSMISREVH